MKHIVVFTFLFLFSLSTFSQSSVWKIEGKGTQFYIGGSIHILRDQDYPLPKEFYEAYYSSDILTTEMDMDEMNNPSNAMKMQKALMYQDEQTLSKVLNAETYRKLDSLSNALGINLKMMDKFKPSMVIIALTFQALQKLGVTSEGVDVHFTQEAKEDKKQQLFLESFDQQLSYIESMGKDNENEFVMYSIDDIEENEEVFTELIETWKTGKLDVMISDLEELEQNYPEIYTSLVLTRNRNWMSELEKYIDTKEVEFVVVGAMHLVGNDGILNQFKTKGYKVTQL